MSWHLAHDLGDHQLEQKHKMLQNFSQSKADLLNAKIFILPSIIKETLPDES